ncbi:sensor histidine kinase [Acrocarpospora catenulata]|uniref:sensor histidine kinase n=1 Tax=Acrocarpospora catenulata TaxID=2836182 RepID=UPI001BDA1A71|nr:histidine kinase [Acrocarpospora catenulata]
MTVLGLLPASFAWAIVIMVSLTEAPSPLPAAVFVLGMLPLGGAFVLVSRVVVDPVPSQRAGSWSVALLVAVSLALWWPTYAWARSGEEPWAWLAGFAVAACTLVSWPAGVTAAVVLGGAAAVGGVVFDSPVTTHLLTTFGCAAVVWLMCQVLVWLLRLAWAAQAGREAEAALVIAQERLRVSRELHDVLGHRLGIIALKAELAADLAHRDPERSAVESEAIRVLATETLSEARRAVHGETTTDLATQLEAAKLVLASAGIVTAVDAEADLIARTPDAVSRLLGVVVREAVTNILRHSDARQVSIALTGQGTSIRLIIVNDGVRDLEPMPQSVSGGTGLASLSARCGAAGARLVAGRNAAGGFELRVDAPGGGATG